MVFHREYLLESDKGGFLDVGLLRKLVFPPPKGAKSKGSSLLHLDKMMDTQRWRRRGLAKDDSRLRMMADRTLERHQRER